MKHLHTLTLACAALGMALPAAAQYTVKVGYGDVRPYSSASDVSGPFTPAGLSLEVHNQQTVLFSVSRPLNARWDLELVLGAPPKHDVALKISPAAVVPNAARALDGQTGAQVTQIAPTLFFNYNFADASAKWRPFVGAGLNYTKFSPADSTAQGDALNGGRTSLSLEDSMGLAAQAGVSYRFNDKWSLTAGVATADVKTKLTTNTNGIIRKADITFHPIVVSLMVGYTF